MTLPIITADQRLAEPRGIKGCIFGKSGHRQDQPALDAQRLDHALLRPRGRRSRDRGLAGRHDPAAHLERVPRLRRLHRRAEPGAARRSALQPGALRRGLRAVRRSRGARPLRHRLHRLDHRGRPALLPVVQGPARGVLGEDRQAGRARRLRAARPRDDRLADPPAAHPRRRTSGSSGSSTRSSTTSIARSSTPQIDGSKTGLELPGIVDQVITMAEIPDADGKPAGPSSARR